MSDVSREFERERDRLRALKKEVMDKKYCNPDQHTLIALYKYLP